jgi:DNA polymerase I
MELKFDLDNPKYVYVQTLDQLNAALDELEKEKVVGVDVESNSLDSYFGFLITIQIATPTLCYTFDARKIDLGKVERFKNFLENKGIIKIFHNGKFDYKFIKNLLGISPENIFDTMLAEVVLNSGIGKGYYSLKDVVRKYTNLELAKETRETFERFTKSTVLNESQLKYAAIDVLIMFPVFEAQLEILRKENLVNIAKLEFAVTRVVGDMELTGIYLDKAKWKNIIVNLQKNRDILAAKFQETIKPYYFASAVDLFGNHHDLINVNSNAQLLDLFNNRLKINIPSTGDSILAGVDHPVARILRDYRKYEKLVSAFGDSLLEKINKKTGRLHPEFNQLGAATGRFSCNKPNLQQIPRNSEEAPFRTCFNPKPGYKLVVADYSAFEMRILAELSQDQKMIKAINDDLDIHSYTAALMFNKEYSKDFKKLYPELRQIAKPIGFGLMYGMGPMGLANQLSMETGKVVTKEQGEDYQKRYFASYPSVQKFLEKIAKDAVRNGWSSTPAGRKRWYHKPENNDPDYRQLLSRIEREAKNHPIQGTNADAVKYALVFISDRMKKEGIDGHITHTVHDEIVTEIREDQAEDWAKVQSEEMVKAGKLFIKSVKVVSEPFVGDVWEH